MEEFSKVLHKKNYLYIQNINLDFNRECKNELAEGDYKESLSSLRWRTQCLDMDCKAKFGIKLLRNSIDSTSPVESIST